LFVAFAGLITACSMAKSIKSMSIVVDMVFADAPDSLSLRLMPVTGTELAPNAAPHTLSPPTSPIAISS
jgi:hypothetical protein